MYHVLIHVKARCPVSELSSTDKDYYASIVKRHRFSVTPSDHPYFDEVSSREDLISAFHQSALDLFHQTVPIKVLEDFDLSPVVDHQVCEDYVADVSRADNHVRLRNLFCNSTEIRAS